MLWISISYEALHLFSSTKRQLRFSSKMCVMDRPICFDRESNTGPWDLQSHALPTELSKLSVSEQPFNITSRFSFPPLFTHLRVQSQCRGWMPLLFISIYMNDLSVSLPYNTRFIGNIAYLLTRILIIPLLPHQFRVLKPLIRWANILLQLESVS